MSEYKEKQTSKSRDEEPVDEMPEVSENDTNIDAILDEIDEVLEENAQEFVQGYIQKGGQ